VAEENQAKSSSSKIREKRESEYRERELCFLDKKDKINYRNR
jgi:hypothetical protein